jgi:TPR repeat protein
LGLFYDIEKEYKKSFEYYQKSANLNYPNAQTKLGELYMSSKNSLIKRDCNKSLELLQKATKQNYPEAFYYMGIYYNNNICTKHNASIAMKYFKKGAQLGGIKSLKILGYSYYKDKNYKKAFEYLKKASKQNDILSKFFIGKMYYYGRYLPKDRKKAYQIFKNIINNIDEYNTMAKIYKFQLGLLLLCKYDENGNEIGYDYFNYIHTYDKLFNRKE